MRFLRLLPKPSCPARYQQVQVPFVEQAQELQAWYSRCVFRGSSRRSTSRNIVGVGGVVVVIATATATTTATIWTTAIAVSSSSSESRSSCVLHGHDPAAVIFPDDLVVVPPAIAKSHLGPEMARRRACRPAHEAWRELDALVAAAVAGLAVYDDAPGGIEVDVGISEQVDVVVAGAQPAIAIVAASAIARQPVFDLFDNVRERRGLQRRCAQLVVDERRVGGRVDGAAVQGERQQLANGQLDSWAMAGHLFIWWRSMFSQPHDGMIACLLACLLAPELLSEPVEALRCAATTRSGYRVFPSRAVARLLTTPSSCDLPVPHTQRVPPALMCRH